MAASSHEFILPSPRRPWWKRWWARGVQALLVLVLLAVATRFIEDWRGARALRLEKEAMRLRGEPLELSAILLPPVPPEENFMESPIMGEIWDGIPVDESSRWVKATSLDEARMRERLQNKRLKAEYMGFPNPENIEQWRDGLEKAEMLAFSAKTDNPAEDICQAWDATAGPFFQELYEAAQHRPQSRLEFADERLFGYGAEAQEFGHKINALQRLSWTLAIRSRLALMTSHPEEAIQCLRVVRRLSEAYHSIPDDMGFLYYSSHLRSVTELVYAAAKAQAFTSTQWREVVEELKPIDIHASYLRTVRGGSIALTARMQSFVGERQSARSEILEAVRLGSQRISSQIGTASEEAPTPWIDSFVRAGMTLVPSGWYYQNNATLLRWREEYLLRPLRGHSLPHLAAHLPDYQRMVDAEIRRFRYHPEKWMALQASSGYLSLAKYACKTYIQVEMARTAAALEIFYQETGQYPESLAALAPAHLPVMPIDLDGRPLR